MRLLAAAFVFAGLAACGFNPHPKNGALPCDNGCPPGYVCGTDNRCWQGAGPDAGAGGTTGPVGTGGASTSRLDAPVSGTGGTTGPVGAGGTSTSRLDAPVVGTGETTGPVGGGGTSTTGLDAPVFGTGGTISTGGTGLADAPIAGTGGTTSSTGGRAQTGGTTSRSGGNSGSGGTGPSDPFVWVAIQDTEQKACATNGPGPDIDAVALVSAAGTALGYGKIGTAVFTVNPLGNSCENVECSGGNCKYAWNGTTFRAETLVSYTEGPPDAVVQAVGDGSDYFYFSLNAGTLQIQIGDLRGVGAAKQLKSGDYLQVFELDKGYIASGSAPATCSCLPEHYTVLLQSQSGLSVIPLTPVVIDTANNTTCAPLTAASTQGCGTTMFRVP